MKIALEDSKSDTDLYERAMIQTVKEYQYTKTISDTQSKPFQMISNRRDKKAALSYQDQKNFQITKDNRDWIIDKIAEKHPKLVDSCKESWNQQDIEKASAQTKSLKKGIDHSR